MTHNIVKQPTPPQIRVRIMVYVNMENMAQFHNMREIHLEPHPFDPRVAEPEMINAVTAFLHSEIDRLDKLFQRL